MNRTVTLTDASGNRTGTADLLVAHSGEGMLHQAFSVYVFNLKRDSILIQLRSEKKMLWPLIWANTCCSHPYENEAAVVAGERRLGEELGFSCALIEGPSFVYRAVDPNGKGVEHEHVTILVGTVDPSIVVKPNPDEVADSRWITIKQLEEEMADKPEKYAPWFHLGLKELIS